MDHENNKTHFCEIKAAPGMKRIEQFAYFILVIIPHVRTSSHWLHFSLTHYLPLRLTILCVSRAFEASVNIDFYLFN